MTQTPGATAPPSESTDPHPSPAVLIAYHREELTEAEADGVREHLVDCEGCMDSVLSMARLEEDLRTAEPAEEPAMVRSLERLRRRQADSATAVPASRPVEAPVPEPVLPVRTLGGWGWAQAALVVLCLGLGGLSLSQRQEIGRLTRPVGNLEPLRLSAGEGFRGGDLLRLGEGSGGLEVQINVPIELRHSGYRVDLAEGDGGQILASLSSLEPGAGGFLSVFFPRQGLRTGTYSLELVGNDSDGTESSIETFRFRLEVER